MSKKRIKDKLHQIFNVMFVFLMLFSNLPAVTVDALQSETVDKNSIVSSFDGQLISSDNDEYKLSAEFAEENSDGYRLSVIEIDNNFTDFSSYQKKVYELLKSKEVSLKYYSISIAQNNNKVNPENKVRFLIEKIKNADDLQYEDTQILVLCDDDTIIKNEFSVDFNGEDKKIVLVLSNRKKTTESSNENIVNTEDSAKKKNYEISAVFVKETDVLRNDNIEIKEFAEAEDYKEYAENSNLPVDGYYAKYLNYFDLKINKEEDVEINSDDIKIKVELKLDENFDKYKELQIVSFDKNDRKLIKPLVEKKDDYSILSFVIENESDFALVETNKEITLRQRGRGYLVTAVFDGTSSIPSDAKLRVIEIKENDSEFEDYVNKSSETLGENPENIVVVKAFDIALIDPKTNEEYQPDNNVRISIELTDDSLNDYSDVEVVHIDEKDAEVLESSFNGETIEFETGGFSVYVIVNSVVTQVLTDTDNKDYLISVTFDNTSGIPENAQLVVNEIKERNPGYAKYVAKAAETLGENPDNFVFAKVFDIVLKDPSTGKEYQPNKDVQVSIKLLKEDVKRFDEVEVVHIHGENEEQSKEIDSSINGETVEFKTDGFSVYVLTGVHKYTYRFWVATDPELIEETEHEEYYLVRDWEQVYEQIAISTDIGNAYTQVIKNGEKPVVPQYSTGKTISFAGWYEASVNDDGIHLSKTEYDFDNINISETKTINIFARYSGFVYAIFHDQFDSDSSSFPISYIRRAEIKGEYNTVKIDDVVTSYRGGTDMYFKGWSFTPVTMPGSATDDDGNEVSIITDDTISILQDTDLYPVFMPVHWLSYYSSSTGSGATYIPTAHYFEGDGPEVLEVPEWSGHQFQGWYLGSINPETGKPTYSVQISNAEGTIVARGEDFSDDVIVLGGKLILKNNVTLYALWGEPTVDYKVVIWKQRLSDEADIPDSQKTYDFVKSCKETAAVDSTVSVDETHKEYNFDGYAYSRCDDPVKVDSGGYTILNVYYDKVNAEPTGLTHILKFTDSVGEGEGKSKDLPIEYSGEESVQYNAPLARYVPADPETGRSGFSFSGWYADSNCSTRVFFDEESYNNYRYSKVLYSTMPDEDLTVYAGWSAEWYLVQIDPNYGTFNGTGSTWFWETVDGDLVREYTQITRDYVESSSGTYFYVKKDRAYYGYTGNEWDQSEPDRDARYTQDPNEATEDKTFEKAPGIYSYAGWYEVKEDGTEVPYDFSKHVDHDLTIKLHWKKNGVFYIRYDSGDGTLSGSQDTNGYGDDSGVLITCGATKSGYNFIGWKVRGDNSGRVYAPGQIMKLNAQYATMVGGKETVYLDAEYSKAGTASIIYDPNGGKIYQGGDIEHNIDFGHYEDPSTHSSESHKVNTDESGTIKVSATVYNLDNNSNFVLSDGTGFSHDNTNLEFAGWSSNKKYNPETDILFEAGQVYGVDTNKPVTLYAVWKTKVVYHLNNPHGEWGESWGAPYILDDDNNYYQYVYINNSVSEPINIPVDQDDKMFYFWTTTASDENSRYDFSNKITDRLDLYAFWDGPIEVKVHAVDATNSPLTEKTDWIVSENNQISVLTERVTVNETLADSYVNLPSQNYLYAFAVALNKNADLSTISEDDAIKGIYYNQNNKHLYVEYIKDKADSYLDENSEIFFVYYQKEALNISYLSMDSDGVLSPATVSEGVPETTGELGEYNVSANLTAPLAWASNEFKYYAYAIGDIDATNAAMIHFISELSDSDSNRPALSVRNSWQGFQCYLNGSWNNCGYKAELYVIYYEKQPSIITIQEETIGTEKVLSTVFDYTITITQNVTTTRTPKTDIYDETTEEWIEVETSRQPHIVSDETVVYRGTFSLSDGKVYSAVLFYNDDNTHTEYGERTGDDGKRYRDYETINTITTQTILVEQQDEDGFTTVNSVIPDIGTSTPYTWTYTSESTAKRPVVTYTNTNNNNQIEVHVALVNANNGTVTIHDDYRSNDETKYSFSMSNPGETTVFTETLKTDELFTGDSNIYAFGSVVVGTSELVDNSEVTIESMEVYSVSYERASNSSVYELVLKDKNGNRICEIGDYKLYYMYYPMPKIQYMKEYADGTLARIKGSTDEGTTESNTITYNFSSLRMNGVTVTQDQRFEISVSGKHISQETGPNNFRMPPILDDGTFARYLSYVMLGAGDENAHSISDISVTDGLSMYLRIDNNRLEWSFDNATWRGFAGTATVYAIYSERGYDLKITKKIPIDVGGDPNFNVIISSTAITKDSYSIEGWTENTISAEKAHGEIPGTIEFTVEDGTDIKIIGLGQGSYTITESGHDNYILTARSGPINGTLSPIDVLNNSIVPLTLDGEKKLELTNTSKAICKIVVNGFDRKFYTLQSAVEYIAENLSTSETIEMLTDYIMPATDIPVIPSGYSVTLKTSGDYESDTGSLSATIKRDISNKTGSLITNRGILSIENITFDGQNVEADNALITSYGDIHLSAGTLFTDTSNLNGNGGAIYVENGAISLSNVIFNNNKAKIGGAIWSSGGDISIRSATNFTGNKAEKGGAIYYASTGEISITDEASFTENQAVSESAETEANGGAIYLATGTISVSGNAVISENEAKSYGGAFYSDNGAVGISGGTVSRNSAINGSAVFVNTGSASFSGGNVTGNVSGKTVESAVTEGGAVGVGTSTAKLYFYTNAKIQNNTIVNGSTSNVYLDQDNDMIINAEGLSGNAYVGVYVSGPMDEEQFVKHGEPGTRFGTYTNKNNLNKFHNDRLSSLTAMSEDYSKRIIWGKPISVVIRYLGTYTESGFPQKIAGNWNGQEKKTDNNYILPGSINSTSSIAEDLISKGYNAGTSFLGVAFVENTEEQNISYDDYITEVNWNNGTNSWDFIKHNGDVLSGTQLIIYFSEPVYISIENNTGETLNIDSITILGKDVVADGYGYVFARNGVTQSDLIPVTSSDLSLGAAKSIKIMLPGGMNKNYTVNAGFTGAAKVVSLKQTGVSKTSITTSEYSSFTLDQGKTSNTTGKTVEVIFGGDRPICKIVYDGVENTFTTLNEAINFINSNITPDANGVRAAKIEMLTDYQLPKEDVINLGEKYDLTITTAVDGIYHYDFDPSKYDPADPATHPRAKISRSTGNDKSFFKLVTNNVNDSVSKLTVQYIDFDGKAYGGNIDGGAVNTKNYDVNIQYSDFLNFKANNGGAVYVDYSETYAGNNNLRVSNTTFTGCQSSASTRKGGGAIWTVAKEFYLSDSVFTGCTANDQGGAVFHRIDATKKCNDKSSTFAYAADSKTIVDNCSFINCKAKAAGGIETEAYNIIFTNCIFDSCSATERNAGALNIYIYEGGSDAESVNAETYFTAENCTFNNCTTPKKGGALRITTKYTTLTNCNFYNSQSTNDDGDGGGVYNGNTFAEWMTMTKCLVTGCNGKNGGGVFMKSSNALLTVDNCIITGNTAKTQGAGIYTNSALIMKNNTQITDNHLSNSTASNGAGVYINQKTLTIGSSDATQADTSTVKNNTVNGGVASNVRLWSGNNQSSVEVLCDLGGYIGVINPGAVGTQFGIASNSTPSDRPAGLSDSNHVINSDDGSTYGVIDRSDTHGQKIIWAGPPICKITDMDGNILYLDSAGEYAAIFDMLDSQLGAGDWTSAFSHLRNPNLYYKTIEETYESYSEKNNQYCVKMLVDNYVAKKQVETKLDQYMSVILTTASSTDKDYPYRGQGSKYCTIIRGSGNIQSMIKAKTNLILEDIIIDGGYKDGTGLSISKPGGLIWTSDVKGAKIRLGKNATLQNSYTTANGGAVYVDYSDFVLDGGTIQNCISAQNGGAIYMKSTTRSDPSRGYLDINGGTITNCEAKNGGAIYIDDGTVTINAGLINNCKAISTADTGGNGGGIFYNKGSNFYLNGGTISNCHADGSGGGVFVNNKEIRITNAFIMRNEASKAGGGIATTGTNAKITLSESPYISGNTSELSVASGNTCNIEMDREFNVTNLNPKTMIHSEGLSSSAKVGVYVPGDESLADSLYNIHGVETTPFGTYKSGTTTDTLYCFINDRNGLRGGIKADQQSNDYKVYWIKIFSLEVAKEVTSHKEEDYNTYFKFNITLSGRATDGTYAENITTTPDTNYGDIVFDHGIATIELKNGESKTAVKLPAGLTYTVTEELSSEQSKYFTALPNVVQSGTIGENAGHTEVDPYLSLKKFTNIRPICKILDKNNNLLYYRLDNKYIPAVFMEVEDAFDKINGKLLYFAASDGSTTIYYQYNDSVAENTYSVQMLVSSYTIKKAVTINNNKRVTLTTAKTSDSQFPYQDSENRSTIARGHNTGSMFTTNGVFTLKNIQLNGKKETYTVEADGGLVFVDKELYIESDAILRNSAIYGKKGAAIYVNNNGSVTMNGGRITENTVKIKNNDGKGAGIYLEKNGKLYLSGSPNFGGKGVQNDGTINNYVEGNPGNINDKRLKDSSGNDLTNGTKRYIYARQDIYIVETRANNPSCIIVKDNLSGEDGIIWVWAENANHNKSFKPFAKVEGSNNNLAVFRNAQDDITSENETRSYLFGTTGETAGLVYWSGGYRQVILRKVDAANPHNSLIGAKFIIYRGSTIDRPYSVNGEVLDGTQNPNPNNICVSNEDGIFYVGNLPYGTYYIYEAVAPSGHDRNVYSWYYLIVSDEGEIISSKYSSWNEAYNARIALDD